jgi:oligosaccharide repeat unit polymerase
MGTATTVICAGLLVTWATMPVDFPYQTYSYAAAGVGASLVVALAIETMATGFRGLLRTDILMLIALYGLTLAEFLFPQKGDYNYFDFRVSPRGGVDGTDAVFLGFAGIALGRHLVSRKLSSFRSPLPVDVGPRTMFRLFLAAAALGYLHILLAVHFDLLEAIRQMALPRFSQSWQRGKYGSAVDLLFEVGALTYLIPPLAGCVYAQAKRYSLWKLAVITAILLLTLYYGFAGGTRNVFAVYLITLAGAYFAMQPKITLRQILTIGVPAVATLMLAMLYMLEFRGVGLENYSFERAKLETLSVDYNIVVISKLTEVFPRFYPYLGLEVPYIAIIRPIPRAIWASKPAGLSITMENALGVDSDSTTLAASFVGESYIAGGMSGVLIAGLLLGAAAGKWNQMGYDLSSNFKLILYVSGFFAAALAMRTILAVVPATLPTLALWLYGRFLLDKRRRRLRAQ